MNSNTNIDGPSLVLRPPAGKAGFWYFGFIVASFIAISQATSLRSQVFNGPIPSVGASSSFSFSFPMGTIGSSSSSVTGTCKGSRALFPLPPPSIPKDKDLIDVWIASYHGTVSDIVNLHMSPQKYACSENDARAASTALILLAGDLEPFSSGPITEDDLASVLLEYLRVYECTLREHEPIASLYVERDLKTGSGVSAIDLGKELLDRQQKIAEELRTARPAMHRLLATIGTLDRLRPLQSSLECFQRSSLDIRNLMGLTADVSACLPRALDARGSLRDLPSSGQ